MTAPNEPTEATAARGPTPSQTVGPFFAISLRWLAENQSGDEASAHSVRVTGTVLDGVGEPVPDAVVEVWPGFARALTDDSGRYRLATSKPAPGSDGQAPHLDVSVFGRGLLQRLMTRLYFPDEEAANQTDPLLTSIEDPARRSTLLARAAPPGGGGAEPANALQFDIRLQGDEETVFLAW